MLRIVGGVAGQTSYVVTHRDRQIYILMYCTANEQCK